MLSRLTTKWRKPHNHYDANFSLPTRDDLDDSPPPPMDSQEQEELVRSFEKSHAEHSLFWRRVFATFLLVQAVFLIYSIFQQALAPWELRFHAYFMDEVQSWMIIFTGWVSVVACLMGIMGLLHRSDNRRQWIWYSCYIGIIPAGFWLCYMLRKPKFQWEILWLPFGPFGGAGISLYVDHLLSESAQEIRKLRDYMYAYKSS